VSYASIEDLRSQLGSSKSPEVSAAYAEKMLHKLPETKVVDRAEFILSHVKGKRVLEFGASGPMSMQIRRAALDWVGVDREYGTDGVIGFDLDDVVPDLPSTMYDEVDGPLLDVIVCGEVLEHLSNPGWFLTRLRKQYAGVPVLITVPNAFAEAGKSWLKKGYENVNKDHVAWYSPKTLSVLLERAGYTCGDLYYYNGHGPTAEGLIVIAE
jgi:2-polyprenyl-3-methyl-5-hydroxy-6-metoxy-1,4-benzoquinol methylase